MSVVDISKEMRDLILKMAAREDIHSLSCQFRDTELWVGLLDEQVKRAKQQNKAPKEAFFLSGPDSGIPIVAKQYSSISDMDEKPVFDGSSLEEKMGGEIHIPYEGVCGADFLVYPTWRKFYPEQWARENAQLDWATSRKNCNHLLIQGDFGVPSCATRIGPIDNWWLYSSTAHYKDCNRCWLPVSRIGLHRRGVERVNCGPKLLDLGEKGVYSSYT